MFEVSVIMYNERFERQCTVGFISDNRTKEEAELYLNSQMEKDKGKDVKISVNGCDLVLKKCKPDVQFFYIDKRWHLDPFMFYTYSICDVGVEHFA